MPQPTPPFSRQTLSAGQADDGAGASNEQTEPCMPTANVVPFLSRRDETVRIGSRSAILGLWESEGLLLRSLACGRNGTGSISSWHARLSPPLTPCPGWLAQGLEAWALVLLLLRTPVWPRPQTPPQLHEGSQRPAHLL